MQFEKLSLQDLLSELGELPSHWMDDVARDLVSRIGSTVGHLRGLGRPVNTGDLSSLLAEDPSFLDVCRLFLGKGQEPVAHLLCDELGGARLTWSRLRSLAGQEPQRMAEALTALGLPVLIDQHLHRRWEVEDILVERYKMSRGRAIAGQKRGRGLEDEVASRIRENGIPFERGVTFTGRKGETAKCDFAIPHRNHPRIVVETKGFEATGSKLTDFLGDILKIAQAKDFHMYFFLVTNGRGWHNRLSDLRKIVDLHQEGLIDMIYTRARLDDLAQTALHIHKNE